MAVDPQFVREFEAVWEQVGRLWERAGFDPELQRYLHEADVAMDEASGRLEKMRKGK